MKKLNLRVPKPYEYRAQSGSVPLRRKYYCICEGPTEESYFWGVRNNRAELNIKNDVHIEIIPKEEGQESYSHPMQLVNACLSAMGQIDKDGNVLLQEEWEKNCKWDDFDSERDAACIIFDRDYKNLEQYLDEIFRLCQKNHIRIVMSNPNFELWLLMHFPDISQYKQDDLLENKKNRKKERFPDASVHKKCLEILVAKHAQGYKKGRDLSFERFLPHIHLAVQQAKLFCEDERKICDYLGTAAGKLIQDMRS